MHAEAGRKGGWRRAGGAHPFTEGHGGNLPDEQFARQAKLAHSDMETFGGSREHGDMPAKKPSRPAPVTLRKWRLYRGLTLEQVANIVGKGTQAVHKWEVGKTPVDLETLKLLAQAYETSPDALLHDPEDEAMILRMRAAYDVLKTLPTDDAERWIAVGQTMAGRKPPNDQK